MSAIIKPCDQPVRAPAVTGAQDATATRGMPVLFILAATQFIQVVDMMIVNPLGPRLMPAFGLDAPAYSWLLGVYTMGAALVGLLAARHMDRIDRRRALIGALLLFALANACCALASSYRTLLLARACSGALGGMLGSLCLALVADLHAPERRGQAIGVVMGTFGLAASLGVPIALTAANLGGWTAPFWLLGALSILTALLAARGLPRVPRTTGQAPATWRQLLTGDAPGALCLTALLALSGFLIIPFIGVHYVANVGVTQEQLPLIYCVGGLATMLSGKRIGVLNDRFGARRVFVVAALSSLLPILLLTTLGAAPLIAPLLVSTLLFILMTGRQVPALAIAMRTVAPALRGGFMSLNSAVQALATGLGARLAGQLLSVDATTGADGASAVTVLRGYPRCGLAACAVTLSAVALALWLTRATARPAGGP